MYKSRVVIFGGILFIKSLHVAKMSGKQKCSEIQTITVWKIMQKN